MNMDEYNDPEEFYLDNNAYSVGDKASSYRKAWRYQNELAKQRQIAHEKAITEKEQSVWSGINAFSQNDRKVPAFYSDKVVSCINAGILIYLSANRFRHKDFPTHDVDIYYDEKTRDIVCFSDRYREVHIQGVWYKTINFASLHGYLANRTEKPFSAQQKIPPAEYTPTKIIKSPPSSKKKSLKKEDMKMDYERTPSPRKTTKTATMKAVKDALVHGTKVAVADEASNVMLMAAKLLLGDAYPVLMSTPDGQEVAKGLTAIALMYATDVLPGVIPQEDAVRTASTLVLEAVSRDLVQPRLAALQPVLMQLAAAGAKVLTPTEK